MMKYVLALILLLNVTNYPAIADCVTGFACTLKDINTNNTNSVNKEEFDNSRKEIKKQENITNEKIEEHKSKVEAKDEEKHK